MTIHSVCFNAEITNAYYGHRTLGQVVADPSGRFFVSLDASTDEPTVMGYSAPPLAVQYLGAEFVRRYLEEGAATLQATDLTRFLLAVNQGLRKQKFVEFQGHVFRPKVTALLLVVDQDQFRLAHLGNCRVYRVRDGELTQVTEDQNFFWRNPEMQALATATDLPPQTELIRASFMNSFAQYMGAEQDFEPVEQTVPFEPGDRLLIAPGSIWYHLENIEIKEILSADAPVLDMAGELFRRLRLKAATSDRNIFAAFSIIKRVLVPEYSAKLSPV
jgi:serine/threonine protein phosphatase PrpC